MIRGDFKRHRHFFMLKSLECFLDQFLPTKHIEFGKLPSKILLIFHCEIDYEIIQFIKTLGIGILVYHDHKLQLGEFSMDVEMVIIVGTVIGYFDGIDTRLIKNSEIFITRVLTVRFLQKCLARYARQQLRHGA